MTEEGLKHEPPETWEHRPSFGGGYRDYARVLSFWLAPNPPGRSRVIDPVNRSTDFDSKN